MTAVLAWIGGTKVGRWLAGIAAAAVVAAGILLRAYSAGLDREVARQTDETLETLRSRNATDDQVDAMGDAARRHELASWVRNDGR